MYPRIVQYADDIAILCSLPNKNNSRIQLKESLNNIYLALINIGLKLYCENDILRF